MYPLYDCEIKIEDETENLRYLICTLFTGQSKVQLKRVFLYSNSGIVFGKYYAKYLN